MRPPPKNFRLQRAWETVSWVSHKRVGLHYWTNVIGFHCFLSIAQQTRISHCVKKLARRTTIVINRFRPSHSVYSSWQYWLMARRRSCSVYNSLRLTPSRADSIFALHKRCLCDVHPSIRPSVRLSVRLSRSCLMSKLISISWIFFTVG